MAMLARHNFFIGGRRVTHLNGGHGSRRDEDATGCVGMANMSVWAACLGGGERRVTVGRVACESFALATKATSSLAESLWSYEGSPNVRGDTVRERPRGDIAFERVRGVMWAKGLEEGTAVFGEGEGRKV